LLPSSADITERFALACDKAKSLISTQRTERIVMSVAFAGGLHGYLDAFNNNFEEVLQFSKNERYAFDCVSWSIAEKIEKRSELSDLEIKWIGELLRSEFSPPKHEGGRPSNRTSSHTMGILALLLSSDFGLSITRNDASEPFSACDAIAVAMKELERKPSSYSRIKSLVLSVKARKVAQKHTSS